MRVLVTGARTYYSLAVIRNLGRAGHHVTAVDWHARSLGFYSRYTRNRWVCPPLNRGSAAFVHALADYLQAHPHDVVLPLYEEGLAMSRHADVLARHAYVPLAGYDAMMRFHDKRALYAFAREQGVPVPRWEIERDERVDGVPFPIVLKVPQSSSATGVAKVDARAGVAAARQRLLAAHGLPTDAPLIAQEFVAASQLCTLSFAFQGRPKGTVVYRNICELPARGGAGIARESIAHDGVERHVDTLLRAAKWHGIVGFDFLSERSTGNVLLIDANPRPTPGLFLAQRCGLDLVAMAVAAAESGPAARLQVGLRTRIDPLVGFWCLRSLVPHRQYARDLRLALSFLKPKSASRSDVFDSADLPSLRGLLLGSVEALWGQISGRGLSALVRPSQYQDYESVGWGSARRPL